jgi:hypothetical protein
MRLPKRRQRAVKRHLPQARFRVGRGVRVRVPEGALHDLQRLAPGPARLAIGTRSLDDLNTTNTRGSPRAPQAAPAEVHRRDQPAPRASSPSASSDFDPLFYREGLKSRRAHGGTPESLWPPGDPRGSTVRVRQRALMIRGTVRKWAVFVALPDTEEHLPHKEGVDVLRGPHQAVQPPRFKRLAAERLTSRTSGDRFWGRNWSSPCLAGASGRPRGVRPCRRWPLLQRL